MLPRQRGETSLIPRQARRAAADCAGDQLRTSSPATARHTDHVAKLAAAIADQLGLTGGEREQIVLAARLHDVGKASIPPSVLDKPGPLSRLEWELMLQHTLVGEQMLEPVGTLADVAAVVRHTHERWDGLGYPDGLKGEQIPLASRVVFCADAYDAIRSSRPYSRGKSAAKALSEIRRCAGTQFDPRVVEALAGVVRRWLYARRRPRLRGRPLAVAAIMGAFLAPVAAAAVSPGSGPLGWVGVSAPKPDSGSTGGHRGTSSGEPGAGSESGKSGAPAGTSRDHNDSAGDHNDSAGSGDGSPSAPAPSSSGSDYDPGGTGSGSSGGGSGKDHGSNGHGGGGSGGSGSGKDHGSAGQGGGGSGKGGFGKGRGSRGQSGGPGGSGGHGHGKG